MSDISRGPSRDELTIVELLESARNGCVSSLGELLEKYRPYLLQIANEQIAPNLRSKAGGSDLVQQSFMEAGAAINGFRGNTSSEFGCWLREILLNNLSNTRRYYSTDKRQIARELQLNESGDFFGRVLNPIASDMTPSAKFLHQVDLDSMQKAFSKLPAVYQDVIVGRNRDRKSFQEIGGELGRSADAARKIWARAIAALRLQMNCSVCDPE